MKNCCKVAFILPYYPGRNHSPFLGVGYLSSVLQQSGHKTVILDEDAAWWVKKSQGSQKPNNDAQAWIGQKLIEFDPDIICISLNTANYENGLRILKFVRDLMGRRTVVVGGPHISTCWQSFKQIHNNLFDVAIIGEGEELLLEICERFATGNNFLNISGVVLAEQDEKDYIPRRLLPDLDNLPYPDREGFYGSFASNEIKLVEEHYHRVFYSALPGFNEQKHARVVASRGCNHGCTFCSPAVYWRDPITRLPYRRLRSPVSIVNEIEFLIDQGVTAIYFDDPTFPILSEPEFFNGLVAEIKKRRIEVSWGAPVRSDEISLPILEVLKSIGFKYTYFGLENYLSGNLNIMGKPLNIKHCLNIVEWCNKNGVHCDVSYQLGLPGENWDSIVRSIKWLRDQGLQYNTFFSITAIWPETPMAHKYGVQPHDFEPYIDKSLMEKRGLYYFTPGNPLIEDYFSNCSGTYHFITEEEAVNVKYHLIDSGFCNRFKQKKTINK